MSLRTASIAGVLTVSLTAPAVACETAGYQGDGRQRLHRPAKGPVVSGFGIRKHPLLQVARMHTGVDFEATTGEPVVAAARGRIAEAGSKGEYGNYIRIDHGDGFATAYGHLNRLEVREGDCVAEGTVIGYAGSTGLSSGPQLHFEVIVEGKQVDPATFIGEAAQ